MKAFCKVIAGLLAVLLFALAFGIIVEPTTAKATSTNIALDDLPPVMLQSRK